MKSTLLSLMVCFTLMLTAVLAEGFLPDLTEVYGVDMPSMSAVLSRVSDREETLADGSRKVVYTNVTEDDFDAFSEYMDSFGCALADYTIEGAIFTATIEKQGASFSFAYDMEALTCELVYPAGTNEESQSEAITRNLKVGAAYIFGSYEQDNNTANGKEPIEWIILDKREDGSLVLLSKYALDAEPYNTKYTDVTWETCTLRKWLNEDFYNEAFNAIEKAKIQTVRVENEDNPYWGTDGGNDTEDRVWLLSINEVTNRFTSDKVYSYFADDASRMCAPTKYAVARGAWQSSNYTVDGVGACWWWLRSSGNESRFAAYVSSGGLVYYRGHSVNYDLDSVRPVVVVLP